MQGAHQAAAQPLGKRIEAGHDRIGEAGGHRLHGDEQLQVALRREPAFAQVPGKLRIFEGDADGALERLVPETWKKLSVITATGVERAAASSSVPGAIHVPATGVFVVRFAPDHADHRQGLRRRLSLQRRHSMASLVADKRPDKTPKPNKPCWCPKGQLGVPYKKCHMKADIAEMNREAKEAGLAREAKERRVKAVNLLRQAVVQYKGKEGTPPDYEASFALISRAASDASRQ